MRIVIAGATGRTGAILTGHLAESGAHDVVGLARTERSARVVRSLGAEAAHHDLGSASVDTAAQVLTGADVAVFTAGAAGYSEEDFRRIDRDGLVTFARGALRAGVPRVVVLSSMAAGEPERLPQEAYYMRMKGEGDDAVMALDGLEWQIVRPGFLVGGRATGRISVARREAPESITRADVALVLQHLVENPAAKRQQVFEVINGDVPIADALG